MVEVAKEPDSDTDEKQMYQSDDDSHLCVGKQTTSNVLTDVMTPMKKLNLVDSTCTQLMCADSLVGLPANITLSGIYC